MAKLIAIDLGSHRVKIAVYEGAFGRFQLEELRAAPVAQDTDQPPTQEDRLAALSELMGALPPSSRPAIFMAWPGERTSLRHVSLPFGDKAQVEKVLPFEVEGLVPYDMEDIELRHRVLRISPGDSQVLAAMVERAPLVSWLAELQAHGADPRSLDLDADVLGELSDHGIQAVVDLGHSRTLVSLCREGEVIAARALDGGGRALTVALARAAELDWDEAEARKHQANLGPRGGRPAPTAARVEWEGEQQTSPGTLAPEPAPAPVALAPLHQVDVAQVLRQALDPLLAELRSTLIGFEDALEVEIDELILSGGTARLLGLRELLGEALGVPVRMVDPGAAADRPDAPCWGLLYGLGERATHGRASTMELRQGALAFKGDLYLARQVGLYGGVFASCALLAGTIMFGVRTVQLDRQLKALDGQISDAVVQTFPGEVGPDQVGTPSQALAIMTEKTAEVNARVEALGGIISSEPPTVSLLRDLSQSMPPPGEARIDVSELSLTDATITLKAETDGYEAATRIESSLQAADRFKGARKGDEKKTRGGAITFTVTIPRDAESDAAGQEG